MIIHIRLRRLWSIFFEYHKDYTSRPFFKIWFFKNEKVFDFPYCRVIFTRLEKQKGNKTERAAKDEFTINRLPQCTERVAENQPGVSTAICDLPDCCRS